MENRDKASPKTSESFENYLDDLALSQEERDKIEALAAPGPAALLAMMQASPDDFYRYLGRERCANLREKLQRSLSRSEHAIGSPVAKFHATGASLRRFVRLTTMLRKEIGCLRSFKISDGKSERYVCKLPELRKS
jgi:hypothetical protein